MNQIRKRGKALLRKLASDPYLIIGKTAQELTTVIQSQLHDYPAIQAVTAAIAAVDSIATDEPLAIELEHRRLALESALDRWRNHQNLSLDEKQSLLLYIR